MDPTSGSSESITQACTKFLADNTAMTALQRTVPLKQIDPTKFDAIFFPGGHGPLFDLAKSSEVFWLLEEFAKTKKKPIVAVCHGPGIFKMTPHLVKGFRVTGFTNEEEEQAGLVADVPFSLQDVLTEHGAKYVEGEAWKSHVEIDNGGLLITGQNPASSEAAAHALVAKLANKL